MKLAAYALTITLVLLSAVCFIDQAQPTTTTTTTATVKSDIPAEPARTNANDSELATVTSLLHGVAAPSADERSGGNATSPANETEPEKVPLIEQETTQAEEKKDSLAIFFILLIIVLAILMVHALIITEFHYMPESLAIVLLGAAIGLVLSYSKWDWREVETFNPNIFFLVLLPPIIFEQGFNLHKGNFFANIVPILTFSIAGTAISAFVMGFCLYTLGLAGLIYQLSAIESFAFGSMISAVDPVITLAIFQALKVDVQLYMLAFGESMLNDAVAIVLASTAMEMADPSVAKLSSLETMRFAFSRFLVMFVFSAMLGSAIGFVSALLFKHVDLRRTPSLELALLLVFAYLPYGLAEATSLSGIMAILFCAITMSQYTHFNISPITQITMQQTLRTISFVAETCTFAYLGLALFTIKLVLHPIFLIWSIILLFASRAASIFPLSYVVNRCRRTKISMKNQIIMWFTGMRGAVAFALALHMEVDSEETKRVILTTTLFVVLFTIVFMGGTSLPMIKILSEIFPDETPPVTTSSSSSTAHHKRRRSRRTRSQRSSLSQRIRKSSPVILSKTQEMVIFDNSEHFTTEYEAENGTEGSRGKTRMPERKNLLTNLNERIIKPFFVRKFTQQERLENSQKLKHIASEAMKAQQSNGNDSSSAESEVFFQALKPSNSIDSQGHPLLPV